jgi:hypothetical protein
MLLDPARPRPELFREGIWVGAGAFAGDSAIPYRTHPIDASGLLDDGELPAR